MIKTLKERKSNSNGGSVAVKDKDYYSVVLITDNLVSRSHLFFSYEDAVIYYSDLCHEWGVENMMNPVKTGIFKFKNGSVNLIKNIIK